MEKLLDFSRLAAGELTLRLSLVDLVRLVQDCRTDAPMGGAAGNRFADHYKRIKDHFPPVEADADRLKQVLVNLLDNALKFTPAGGKSSWPWND